MSGSTATVPLSAITTDGAVCDWSPRTMILFLQGTAVEELERTRRVHAVEVTVEGLEYGTDYVLGEVVRVGLSTGETMDGVVTEVVESWDSRGYKATPGITRI